MVVEEEEDLSFSDNIFMFSDVCVKSRFNVACVSTIFFSFPVYVPSVLYKLLKIKIMY